MGRLQDALTVQFGAGSGVPLVLLATAAALLLRWLVALWPHSGQGRPPLYGDFEAQRHWMEVTTSLPVGEWYRHTARNDLMHWGLDYPPLTAFHSWAFGSLARLVVPHAIAAYSSRGAEDAATRLFMRLAVLASDALVLLPAIWLFVATRDALHRGSGGAPSTAVRLTADVVPLLILPGLLVIDHGHHQYNGVMLGLVTLAIVAVMQRRWLAAAAVFTLAVQFKVTALYFALPFAALLLATAIAGAGARGGSAPVAVAALALVAVIVTAALWAPFCVAAADGVVGCEDYVARRGDAPWLATPDGAAAATTCSCLGGLTSVARRVVPLDRGLFEDKVANLWCALEPVTRLGASLRREKGASGATLRGRVAAASAALTFALLAPSLVALWLHSRGVWRRFASATAEGGGHAAGGVGGHAASSASLPPPEPPTQAPPAVMQLSPLPWLLYEHLCAALAVAAVAFFLASYQVHEKAILLPLLPLALLAHRLPLTAAAAQLVGVWTMWPLLAKDGLVVPAAVVCAAYATVAWPRPDEVLRGDAVAYAMAWQAWAPRTWRYGGKDGMAAAQRARDVLLGATRLGGTTLAALSVAAYAVPPPAALPDLHAYATAVVGAALLSLLLVALTTVQAAESRP